MIPFLAIHAKGGENMSPKQKDRTTTYFKKLRVSKIFINWYPIVFKRGEFCLVKGKAFEIGGGENFKS
jgi:hypothetical protein